MNFEPGTVAVATVRGVPNVRVMRIQNDDTDFVWVGGVRAGGNVGYFEEEVTDVRSLVVLDLGLGATPSRDAMEFLREMAARFVKKSSEAKFFEWLADQIEAQTKPPRIPEPGLWGVVEASTSRLPVRAKWVRMVEAVPDDEHQWLNDEAEWADWSDLVDPILVRDGIEDAS